MVEPLNKLNAICQKPNYKKVGNWMVRHFERPAALPVTWLLLHTPISANQVTVAAIFTALAAGACMAAGSGGWFLLGGLLLQLWYLLDHVDGQIARYRGTVGPDGVFMDFLMHHIVNYVPFLALGWAAYSRSGDVAAIGLGVLAAVSAELINTLNDCRAKAIHTYLTMTGGCIRPTAYATPAPRTTPRPLPAAVFAWLCKSCELHVVMNALTVFGLLWFAAGPAHGALADTVLWGLLVYYACAATLVWIVRAVRIAVKKTVSEELRETVEPLR